MKFYHTKITLVLLYLILTTTIIFAQHAAPRAPRTTDTNISGHVLDAETGEHLPYITIIVEGTTIGQTTDATGHYFIKNIPNQTIIIIASSLGYETSAQEIKPIPGHTTEVNFTLRKTSVKVDEIVVSASRNETKCREAPTIVNVLSASLMERTSSHNLAEALNYQPGLRVEYTCQNCGSTDLKDNTPKY